MMKWKARETVAIMLCTTVCISILIPLIAAMFHIGQVTDTFREKMFDLIEFIAGVVSGWLLATKETPKDQEKDTNEPGR